MHCYNENITKMPCNLKGFIFFCISCFLLLIPRVTTTPPTTTAIQDRAVSQWHAWLYHKIVHPLKIEPTCSEHVQVGPWGPCDPPLWRSKRQMECHWFGRSQHKQHRHTPWDTGHPHEAKNIEHIHLDTPFVLDRIARQGLTPTIFDIGIEIQFPIRMAIPHRKSLNIDLWGAVIIILQGGIGDLNFLHGVWCVMVHQWARSARIVLWQFLLYQSSSICDRTWRTLSFGSSSVWSKHRTMWSHLLFHNSTTDNHRFVAEFRKSESRTWHWVTTTLKTDPENGLMVSQEDALDSNAVGLLLHQVPALRPLAGPRALPADVLRQQCDFHACELSTKWHAGMSFRKSEKSPLSHVTFCHPTKILATRMAMQFEKVTGKKAMGVALSNQWSHCFEKKTVFPPLS